MKILIISQYYYPEFFLINRLSQKLVELGHQVTVATGKPNYPQGEIYSGYTALGTSTEMIDGVEVIRIPLRPRKKGALGLILNYLSFVLSGLWYLPRLLKGKTFDAILVFGISPITAAIPAIPLKRSFNAHLAIWVQDLWPQSLSSTGYVKNKLVLKCVEYLVRWIYKNADTLLGQSKKFVEMLGCYASKDKVVYYPNSMDPLPLVTDNEKPPEIDVSCFNHGFSVVFAGNIGKAQAIPTLLEAASLTAGSNCQFIFVGQGSMLAWAKQVVLSQQLTNVHFIGQVDNHYMPWIYQQADALLISLLNEEVFSQTIPGKLQASLAASKPIIAALNGEAATVIKEANAGIVTPAEDATELAKAMLKLQSMSEQQRKQLGANGKRYFSKHFDIKTQVENLINILQRQIKACQ